MSLIVEDSESVPCTQCVRLRKAFVMIAVSAVFPVIIFAAILLLLSTEKMDTGLQSITTVIVEFILGLLYVQLFFAAVVLLISFVKRRHPILKCSVWYLVFHVTSMALFLGSSLILTVVNESTVLCVVVSIATFVYFSVLYYFFGFKRNTWFTLRRAY